VLQPLADDPGERAVTVVIVFANRPGVLHCFH
jgi:hypothetical protein